MKIKTKVYVVATDDGDGSQSASIYPSAEFAKQSIADDQELDVDDVEFNDIREHGEGQYTDLEFDLIDGVLTLTKQIYLGNFG